VKGVAGPVNPSNQYHGSISCSKSTGLTAGIMA
jgi:hypothetical protein